MGPKSFRKFVEDKEAAASPYIDSLEDELGIDPRDLEKDPQMASFYSLGKDIKNVGIYRVVRIIRDGSGTPTHAVVRSMEDRTVRNRRYRDGEGGIKRVDGDGEERNFVVPIGDLDKLMSQDFQPPPEAPGGPP